MWLGHLSRRKEWWWALGSWERPSFSTAGRIRRVVVVGDSRFRPPVEFVVVVVVVVLVVPWFSGKSGLGTGALDTVGEKTPASVFDEGPA